MDRRIGALAIAGLVGTLTAWPLVAQDTASGDSMTCADFMAMDSEGQMQAVETMQMASESMMAEDEMAAEGETTEGEMAAEGQSAEGGGMMAEGGGMMEEQMAAISAACDGNPDMMVTDAMMSAQGQ